MAPMMKLTEVDLRQLTDVMELDDTSEGTATAEEELKELIKITVLVRPIVLPPN